MNYQRIKERIKNKLDHNVQSSEEFEKKLGSTVNEALREVIEKFPGVFADDIRVLYVGPDFVPAAQELDVLQVSDNPWVLVTTLSNFDANAEEWQTDRSWDGRTIFLRDSETERWETRIVREVWSTDANRYVSLDRPWNGSATGIQYEFETHLLRLPPDLLKLKSLTLTVPDRAFSPLSEMGQGHSEYTHITQPERVTAKGTPCSFIRRPLSRVHAPLFKPIASTPDGVWAGPEPTGSFEYCYTISIGENEPRTQRNPESQATTTVNPGRYDAYKESPPSQPTAVVTATAPVVITLPDLDRSEGFGTGTTRERRSGFRKRIYRRRIADDSGQLNYGTRWYLLAEVPGHTTTFTDDGSLVPDTTRELQFTAASEMVRLHPRPDSQLRLELRGAFRPRALVDENDTPDLDSEMIEAVILRSVALMNRQHNPAVYQMDMVDYENKLKSIRKNRGLLQSGIRYRRLPRTSGSRYRGRSRRLVYKDGSAT